MKSMLFNHYKFVKNRHNSSHSHVFMLKILFDISLNITAFCYLVFKYKEFPCVSVKILKLP